MATRGDGVGGGAQASGAAGGGGAGGALGGTGIVIIRYLTGAITATGGTTSTGGGYTYHKFTANGNFTRTA